MFPRMKKQAGNLYIVAIFVIVVMGFLAAALSRMEWSNQDALSRDLLGTKAWFAAHSLNEFALTQLYPVGASAAVSSVCEDNWISVVSAAGNVIAQYSGCSASLACNKLGELNDEGVFKVESSVLCGTGLYQVERVQEVLVKE
ncbi:MSHA biogenesis protein MshP [Vibrio fluvialis]|uniref:MSHA biogenesis protein MshP n=1 Tax=Vibrio fluvialis TaxID=676 RepID=UPI00192A775D|nr:MSHA biogenesis protein MshP [Vibrio fluvialis]MBL4307320.1 MSHA biogenesis protein MshP [Vibrio fluvialis]MBY7915848.1 MSHA biogenesis protein MshP [Vibrio fluvialis]MBY8083537.1 MSHA biogenesis protein MshP [Vibrio fluvialis]TNF13128.1 MAG: MSHA biogenesis protein MshP [Vibrionaceae bacterium]